MTIVCGDSHTATHGAFGALAFGIGTSEVEMVLATQTLLQRKPKTYEVRVDGRLAPGVSAKDIILALIARIGIGGGTGHVFEYRGEAIRALNMEQRMTICNMSIEGGARAGLVAPDDTTFDVPPRPPPRPAGRRLGRRRRGLADAADRRRGGVRPVDRPRRRRARADGHLGQQPGHGRRRSRPASRARRTPPTRRRGAASSARSSTWASRRASRSPATRWTWCSSAAAPTAGSATCASRRPSSRTATRPTACG